MRKFEYLILIRKKEESGVAMIEFALMATVIFTLLFAVITYGFMIYDNAVISNATRVGARRGIVADASGNFATTCSNVCSSRAGIPTSAELTAECAAQAATQGLINFSLTSQAVSYCAISTTGADAKITVTGTYNYGGVFIFGINQIRAQTTMYYE